MENARGPGGFCSSREAFLSRNEPSEPCSENLHQAETMIGAASFTRRETREAIDSARLFIAEKFTPLFHTGVYPSLSAAARLRYNQLHALYFNEQVAFFEQEMLSPALHALMQNAPPHLARGLQTFYDEEQRHTARFRELNSRRAPELYAERDYFFVRIGRPWMKMMRAIADRPHRFPLLIWLALLQEERSLFYSKGCLESAAELDVEFVATHRAHLADEVGHVGWDEELLDWLWPRAGAVTRCMNVRLFSWMLGEFFLLPKRSGRRVVEQLVREHPELDASALAAGMHRLANDPAYLRTLYSREITPRTFARFDAHPEFALLAQTLPGYVPRPA